MKEAFRNPYSDLPGQNCYCKNYVKSFLSMGDMCAIAKQRIKRESTYCHDRVPDGYIKILSSQQQIYYNSHEP